MTKQIQIEPLEYFHQKYGVDYDKIKLFISGEKYSALMLNDGKIGICGNVDRAVNSDLRNYQTIDLDFIEHRIFLNCYYNAMFNNSSKDKGEDLLKIVDFSQYRNIVMIGNFHPIVAKFSTLGIQSQIFDLKEDSAYLTPMDKQSDWIKKADCIILTATTISNQTFMPIVSNSAENCDIYLLGPSTPMSPEMIQYRNIVHLFGTSFPLNAVDLLDLIESGSGPRVFLKHGSKTMILNKK